MATLPVRNAGNYHEIAGRIDQGGKRALSRLARAPSFGKGLKMAGKWTDIRAELVADGKLSENRIQEHKARMVAEMKAQKLATIRTTYGLTQKDLAETLQVSQARISQIERGNLEASQIATLRAYASALGGDLEISVRFGDDRIIIG